MRARGAWRLVAAVVVASLLAGCGAAVQIESETWWHVSNGSMSLTANGNARVPLRGGACVEVSKLGDLLVVRFRIKTWRGYGPWMGLERGFEGRTACGHPW